jgi:alpha-tubulin suppressor-like RCC1 family protein
LYIQDYSMHVITKTGKALSTGRGRTAASVVLTSSASHNGEKFHQFSRSFCESDNCTFSKIVASGDNDSNSSFALDEQGYLWGHGVNQYGCLANGTTVHSYDETLAQVGANTIIGKRESLANSETAAAGVPYNLIANREHLPHIINPMLTSSGAVTTNVDDAASLLKATDATHFGSWDGANHPDTVAMIGTDKKVYVVGYGDYGQMGDNTHAKTNQNWRNVLKQDSTPLGFVTKLYSGGQDSRTYLYAIDENYDVWSWGDNRGKNLGTGDATQRSRANRTWDASSRGYRANYIITNDAGSSDGDAFGIIASHQTADGTETSKRFWVSNNGPQSNGNWTQLTHTVFNTESYAIQDLYWSNGETKNFYFVIARNISTNLLELWSAGDNSHGQLGYPNPALTSANSNYQLVDGNTVAYRVDFSSDLLEKVVMIHGDEQNSGGSPNTHIHLSDGRIFSCGTLRWSFDRIGHNSQKQHKLTPIPMDGV